MVAHLQASLGQPEALATIAKVRSLNAGEADVMLAELHLAQGDLDGASAALASAFAAFRADPWAFPRFVHMAVERAETIGRSAPAMAQRMIELLRQPFALKVSDRRRQMILALLTPVADLKAFCGDAFAALEPDVPWIGEVLAARRLCYAELGHPLLTTATRDLNDYVRMEGLPLSADAPAASAAASAAR
jgi:hypothetical protein